MSAYSPMVAAAARVLCQRETQQCEVDFDDAWGLYAEQFIDDAKTVLDAAAAPELLEALQMVRDYVVTMKGQGHSYQVAIDAAIAKATGEAA